MCNLLGIGNLNHDQNVTTCQWLQAIGQPVMGNQTIVDGMASPRPYKHEHLSVHTYPHKTQNNIIINLTESRGLIKISF